jgi:hypothetical protein
MTLEGFGFATKKTSRTEDRGAMAADPNFQQKSQPLGAEEQPESCEVSRSDFMIGSSGLQGRRRKLQTSETILISLGRDYI